MLISRFRKENVSGLEIYRPRFKINIITKKGIAAAYGLVDSGADRTLIPEPLARFLELNKGQSVRTAGIEAKSKYMKAAQTLFLSMKPIRPKTSLTFLCT